jgi:hypothetical protein
MYIYIYINKILSSAFTVQQEEGAWLDHTKDGNKADTRTCIRP